MSMVVGQLRALTALGLMAKVDQISGTSGSIWALAPYMFAAGADQDLLGPATDPKTLTLEALARPSVPLLVSANASWDAAAQQLGITGLQLGAQLAAKVLLEPFGLGDVNSYMAGGTGQVQDVKARNPQLAGSTFYTPRTDRPQSFIMGLAMGWPAGYNPTPYTSVRVDVSPDYTGVPFYPDNSTVPYVNSNNQVVKGVVGGGLLETFAFGGAEPEAKFQSGSGSTVVGAPAEPLSLAKTIAIASGFPPGIFPVSYWPVTSRVFPPPVPSQPYLFTDGGLVENYGLLSSLRSGASSIIVFFNTYQPIDARINWCSTTPDPNSLAFKQQRAELPPMFDLFGYGAFQATNPPYWYVYNQVFPQSAFFPAMCALLTQREAGKPAVYRTKLPVLPNSWWGIEGGYAVDIAFVYNSRLASFESQLPPTTQGLLAAALPSFPNVPTAPSLPREVVNLLSAQGEFAVLQSADVLKGIFD